MISHQKVQQKSNQLFHAIKLVLWKDDHRHGVANWVLARKNIVGRMNVGEARGVAEVRGVDVPLKEVRR